MREVSFIFDYDNGLLTVEDSVNGRATWHIPSGDYMQDDPLINQYIIRVNGKISKSSIHYDDNYPLAILNSILFKCYPYREDAKADLYTQFADPGPEFNDNTAYIRYEINKAVNHLNDNVLKDFPFLKIQRENANSVHKQKLYYFSPAVDEYKISWTIRSSDSAELDMYRMDSSWTSASKQDEIEAMLNSNRGSRVINNITYELDSIEDTTIWKDKTWETLLARYRLRIPDIDESLLPKVKAAGVTFDSLPDYYCNTFIKREKDISVGNSFAIADGGSGSGKTYAVYATAIRLMEAGHRAMVIELPDLYSQEGKRSLIDHICQYASGNANEDNEYRLRGLLSKPGNKRTESVRKTVFIIDGIDEVYSSRVESLVKELNRIAIMGNPDVLFLLSVRNADDFIHESGITCRDTVFTRWDNISVQPLDERDLPVRDKDIFNILRENPITRTPLFVKYYREITDYFEKDPETVIERGSNDRIFENYAEGISREKLAKINNYYDLFNTRTELLCAHARKDNLNPAWYSAVLPCVAYYMYTKGIRFFDSDTIEMLFSEDSAGMVYKWFNSMIHREYPAFKVLFTREIIRQLLSTGIVIADREDCAGYRFEHKEYMQFLAAKFTSLVIRKIDDPAVRNTVLKNIYNKTSYFNNNRPDKMRHIPFARYVFVDVVKNAPITDPVVNERSRQKKRKKGFENFDPLLYKIAANVSYEGRDVYDEAKELTSLYMTYQRGRVLYRSQHDKIEEFDDWQLLDSTNCISYSMLTKRNKDPKKWRMLETIYSDLSSCANVILRNAFFDMEGMGNYQRRGFRKEFPLSKDRLISGIEDLTDYVYNSDRPVLEVGGVPSELLSRLISNLGATCQECAKYANSHKELSGIESPQHYLDEAKEFHDHALKFREAVIHSISTYLKKSESFDTENAEEKEYLESLAEAREKISIIRSLITLAGDHYYAGLFSGDYEDSKVQLKTAIDDYHKRALIRQGIDPDLFKEYKYSKSLDIVERPHVDGESYVICLRAAGALYLLYEKTKKAIKDAEENGDIVRVQELKEDIRDQVYDQYIYLKAAYHYLVEECSANCEGNEDVRLDSIKLEINSKEIDNLFNDCENKYVNSFPLLGELKADGIELLEKIITLYKSLHVYSDVKYLYHESGNYYVVRRYEKEQKCSIEFPPYEEDRKERIRKLIRSAERWSRSDQIADLLWVFGRKIDRELPFKEYIYELNQLVEEWDFRRRMSSKKEEVDIERFDLEDSRFWKKYYPDLYRTISDNRDLINSAAISLGMDDLGDINGNPGYIIPVGGARMVNLFRPMMARKLIDDNDWNNTTVVAIGASRTIGKQESKDDRKLERYYTNKYARGAVTEYDALTAGVCKAFDIEGFTEYETDDISPTDVEWRSMRVWDGKYNGCGITAISAPSVTNLPRRANSYDGFLYFIKKFSPEPGTKVIMVTTNIYRQYQGLSLMDIGVDAGLDVSVIGTDRSIEDTEFGGDPIKFLQDLKATINLIYKFTDPDPKYHCEEYGMSSSYVDDVKSVMEEFSHSSVIEL